MLYYKICTRNRKNNMMKRLSSILISLMLATTAGWAQSGMTDNQVMDYVIEQNAKGTSRQQIVTQLMKAQKLRFYARYNLSELLDACAGWEETELNIEH